MLEIVNHQEISDINEFWIYDDPKYNLCIHLSYLNTSEDESFGSIMIQRLGDTEKIVGVGWNMFVAGETNMKRQGYSNHAEFQSLILAQALGYNVSNPDIPTEIYSAGRLIKSNLLFLHPDNQPFSCTKCTGSISKINPNIHIITPSTNSGWIDSPLSQAHQSAEEFKKNGVKRDKSMDSSLEISFLNISKTQERMDEIVKNIEENGVEIDEVVKEIILNQYEYLLTFPIQERRAYIENIFGSLV